MQFNQDFWDDVIEAFEYWQGKQVRSGDAAAIEAAAGFTPVTWAARMLAEPVYSLIAEKRAMHNSEELPAKEDIEH